MNYADVVEILKKSAESIVSDAARTERFEAFGRAVSFYRERNRSPAWPEDGRGIFLVAGTNGKGTVAKTLESLLCTLPDVNVGLFTSPHLIEPTERIRVGGSDLTQDEMVRVYEMIAPTVSEFSLSHFEILTLMMIEVFFGGVIRPPVTHAVIEVGVGGRIDPTRIIPHETAVIARIGLDHQAMLGDTLDLIAREKLAIAEGAKRVVSIKPDAAIEAAFVKARTGSSSVFTTSREFPSTVVRTEVSHVGKDVPNSVRSSARTSARVEAGVAQPIWVIQTPWGDAPLSLVGERAVQNTSLALEVLDQCGYDVEKMLPALSLIQWPGRMERISFRGRDVYLSGDHNEQGIESLAELLKSFAYESVWLVVGIGKGKPIDKMLKQYEKIPRSRLLLTRTVFRAVDMSELAEFKSRAAATFEHALKALEFAQRQSRPGDMVVVSGSLYLVGDLRAAILAAR